MTTKFPKFSESLAQDPTTRRIWFGIATSHDFESHDGITELRIAKIHMLCLFRLLIMLISYYSVELIICMFKIFI
jgi:hypothetical protein